MPDTKYQPGDVVTWSFPAGNTEEHAELRILEVGQGKGEYTTYKVQVLSAEIPPHLCTEITYATEKFITLLKSSKQAKDEKRVPQFSRGDIVRWEFAGEGAILRILSILKTYSESVSYHVELISPDVKPLYLPSQNGELGVSQEFLTLVEKSHTTSPETQQSSTLTHLELSWQWYIRETQKSHVKDDPRVKAYDILIREASEKVENAQSQVRILQRERLKIIYQKT